MQKRNTKGAKAKSAATDSPAPTSAESSQSQKHSRDPSREKATSDKPAAKKRKAESQSKVLQPLENLLGQAVDSWAGDSIIRATDFYRVLSLHRSAVESADKLSKEELLQDPAIIAEYKVPALDPSLFGPEICATISKRFLMIESCRQQVVAKLLAVSAPSKVARTYGKHQQSVSAFRTGRPSDKPCIGIPYLTLPFYHYFFLRKYLPTSNLKLEPDDLFVKCLRIAWALVNKMKTFHSHDMRGKIFIEELQQILPDDEDYKWFPTDPVVPRHKSTIDYVYRRLKDGYPIIFLEVKREEGEGGDSFAQNNGAYSISVVEHITVRKECGAPAVFISIVGMFRALTINQHHAYAFAGTRLSFGGAICDTQTGQHVAGRLPGGADIEDFNANEIAYSLWALQKCIAQLKNDIPSVDKNGNLLLDSQGLPLSTASLYGTRNSIMNAPKVGIEHGGIKITEVVSVGSLYLAVLDFQSPQEKMFRTMQTLKALGLADEPGATSYMLQTTYPVQNQHYGFLVHRQLAQDGFAPKHYLAFEPQHELDDETDVIKSGFNQTFLSLIRYDLIQFLPSPSQQNSGWVTLKALAAAHYEAALDSKSRIQSTLAYIIRILKDNSMLHRAMLPNNILVKVVVSPDNAYQLLDKPDIPGLLDIKVVNFASACSFRDRRYGPLKNTEDEDEVKKWMEDWPGVARKKLIQPLVKRGVSIRVIDDNS